MFFDYFPNTYFNIDDKTLVLVTDFIRAVKLDKVLKTDPTLFYEYECLDNEMPEIISHKFYKSTYYHWVIMLLNEKFDPYRDFPKDDASIIKMTTDKYTDINGIHHYEDSSGDYVDVFYVGGAPITNLEYERRLNQEKRSIKIMHPEVLSEFVQSYKQLISQ